MDIKHKLSGESGQLTQRVINISVIGMLDRNPGMLSAIRCRDIAPARENTPWAGEYAGKHLTACALLYKLTGNEKLMEYGTGLADGLIGCQDGDGYLGVADKSHRLTGTYQQSVDYYVTVRRTIDYIPRENPEITLWDCWSHYHSVAGLLMWYDITGNDRYADAAKKAADLLMKTFYTPDRRAVSSSGFDVTAYSIYHMFALLYTRYHSPEYYSFLKKMESEIKSFEHNYFDNAISGGEFSKTVSSALGKPVYFYRHRRAVQIYR